MKSSNQKIDVEKLEDIIDTQLLAMASEEIRLDNKLFARQCQKTKEVANLVGKKIAVISQQLYANEMGAQIAVPSMGIPEGTIIGKKSTGLAKLLN